MYERRILGQGGPHTQNGGKLFVVDADEIERLLRLRLGGCRNRNHGLADVSHAVDRQERLVLDGSSEEERKVATGHNNPHARRRESGRRVDRDDAGMGVRDYAAPRRATYRGGPRRQP